MKKMYYSPSSLGFLADKTMSDAVEVEFGDYQRLLDAQVDGFKIIPGADGAPTLVEQDKPTVAELSVLELKGRLLVADRTVSTLQPAVDGGYAKQEHTKLLADWQRYRYELTLVPEQSSWPEKPQWPTEPDKVI